MDNAKECEYLCKQQGEKGCCALFSNGCYWKGGAEAGAGAGVTGISVNCWVTSISTGTTIVYAFPTNWELMGS